MEIEKILTEASALVGPSGEEKAVAEYFAPLFRPFVDEVRIDALYNVIAHKKGTGPRVMLAAHMDEVSMTVSAVEDDGCIRMSAIGGVDPRILPGSRVWVHGTEKLFGTIGAVPPHLQAAGSAGKNYQLKDLYVDIGYSAEEARKRVHIGDLITYATPSAKLLNHQFSSKTMDDRACVTMLLRAAELLQAMPCEADVYFVATTQEEIDSQGALTAAFAIDPDLAVALDVDHATIAGSKPGTTVDLDRLSVTVGPYMQPKLVDRLLKCAAAHDIRVQQTVSERMTYTDADSIIMTRAGVPSILLSLPLKYMHTSVETIDLNVMEDGSRLIANFLSELDSDWGVDLWI